MNKQNNEIFFTAIEELAIANLLSVDEVLEIFKEAIKKSFHSKFDPDAELELTVDFDEKSLKLINHSKLVVEDAEEKYSQIEISLTNALKIDSKVQIGDVISEEVDWAKYSNTNASQIKQILTQNVREKKKEAIYAKHRELKGEVVTAYVTSSAPTHAILALEDGTTAFMPSKFKNPNIRLNIGERVKVYVEEVLRDSKEAQIIVSNGSGESVKRILEKEVPEIEDGTIEIKAISRVAGQRTKVAVKSHAEFVDAVGAIIGANGSRIKTIVEKLDGEKLDVIGWDHNEYKYIANSLAPAKVISVIDKVNAAGEIQPGHKIAITPNKHQTLAIGKQGVNVRLAAQLTNFKLDVISIDEANKRGIEIIWNGNLTPEQVEAIESGQKIAFPTRAPRQQFENHFNKNNSRFSSQNSFDDFEFESDIRSFTESIKVEQLSDAPFEIDEDLFESANIEEIRDDFEIDDLDIDPDFL